MYISCSLFECFFIVDPRPVKDLKAVDVPNGILVTWHPVKCATVYYLTYDLIQRGHCSMLIPPLVSRSVVTNDTSMTLSLLEPFSTYMIYIIANVDGVNSSAITTDATSTPTGLLHYLYLICISLCDCLW